MRNPRSSSLAGRAPSRTPPPAHPLREQREPPHSSRGSFWLPVLLVLLGLSLGLHAWTLLALHHSRTLAQTNMLLLAEQLEQAQQEVLATTVQINQPIPIAATVPLNESLDVTIDTEVTLDDEIIVDVAGVALPVPLNVRVPVNATVPVQIDREVPISTTVALDIAVPVSIPIAETPLHAYLERLRMALLRLESEL